MANALRTGITRSARRASAVTIITSSTAQRSERVARSTSKVIVTYRDASGKIQYTTVGTRGAARRFITRCWNFYAQQIAFGNVPRSKQIKRYAFAERMVQVPYEYRNLFSVA